LADYLAGKSRSQLQELAGSFFARNIDLFVVLLEAGEFISSIPMQYYFFCLLGAGVDIG
jgi:hypothetical protein